MRLTLKSLQSEMHQGFNAITVRIDNLDTNVNERIDRVLLSLDRHTKDSDAQFRDVYCRFDQIDRRFDQIDRRFDQIDQRFGQVDERFVTLKKEIVEEVVEAFSPYFQNVERMLSNHENRIARLEGR